MEHIKMFPFGRSIRLHVVIIIVVVVIVSFLSSIRSPSVPVDITSRHLAPFIVCLFSVYKYTKSDNEMHFISVFQSRLQRPYSFKL